MLLFALVVVFGALVVVVFGALVVVGTVAVVVSFFSLAFPFLLFAFSFMKRGEHRASIFIK